jgi:hypothetical protein
VPNPLYQRLTHRAWPPTLRQTGIIIIILMLASTGLILLRPGQDIMVPIQASLLLALLVFPTLATGVAATITANDAASEAFILQKVTILLPAAVVWGYARASLFRIRLLIALIIGLLPVLVIAIITGEQDYIIECRVLIPGRDFLTASLTHPSHRSCVSMTDIRYILLVLSHFVLIVLVPAGLSMIGILTGIALALSLKTKIAALGAGILLMLIVSVVYVGSIIVTGAAITTDRCSHECTMYYGWPEPLWFALLILPALVLLIYATSRLASQVFSIARY